MRTAKTPWQWQGLGTVRLAPPRPASLAHPASLVPPKSLKLLRRDTVAARPTGRASGLATAFIFSFFITTFFYPVPFLSAQVYDFTPEDHEFLGKVQKNAFEFFLYEHHPETGLVKDRADNFARDSSATASIATTGFGLSAMVVGAERGWVSKTEAEKYALKTLRFFRDRMESKRGFFYHFVHWGTGKRHRNTELSSIDTALFLAGALTAGEYFKGTEVERLANELYERVDFPWMLNGGKTLSMGWDPELGRFLNGRWNDYNESLILYALAIGSPTHPIPGESWHQVAKRIGMYRPYVLIHSSPLFTHQYSQIWLDLRGQNDGLVDYFENSRIATLVNRQFCLDHQNRFKTYADNIWGLTSSLGPGGYRAYGAGPAGSLHDGTVAPTAAGSSIVFTPELSLKALKAIYENYKDEIWGKYGFSDAFNVDRKWYAREVLGIDQGPLLLMIENARSGLLWKLMMRHPAIQRGLQRIGFRPGTIELKLPPRPTLEIPSVRGGIRVNGKLDEWDFVSPLKLIPSTHRELGEFDDEGDYSGEIFFAWDAEFLYFGAKVEDESFVAKQKNRQIWRDDALELFLDPHGDGFRWGNTKDFQIGFSPGRGEEPLRTWVWPHNFDPLQREEVQAQVRKRAGGYDLEAKIAWKLLAMEPQPNLVFGLTPALHDLDADGSEGKLTWYFIPEGKSGRTLLGEVILKN